MNETSIDFLSGKILIVDDRVSNILLLETVLRIAGYRSVTSTTNPCEVVDLHRKYAYDLILLDIEMPVMDGFDVMKGLKEIEPEDYLSVLAITANRSHKLRAFEAGARDFVSKPFDNAEILARARNLLELRLLNLQLKAHGMQLEKMAFYDPLTGLANRRLLEDRLVVAIANANRHKEVMAILYLDLDGFKAINDKRGHAFGDDLLSAVALRLLKAVREGDTVCRLGGDEFVLVLNHIGNSRDASRAASKIIEALSKPFYIQSEWIEITASSGVSCFPVDGCDPPMLLKNADAALCEVKCEGKNNYKMFSAYGGVSQEKDQLTQIKRFERRDVRNGNRRREPPTSFEGAERRTVSRRVAMN